MELIHSLLNNADLNSAVNVKVLVAIFGALVLDRLIGPVISYFNPLIVMLDLIHKAKTKFWRWITQINTQDGTSPPLNK